MVSCNQHDFIEIACLYRYQISVTLINGSEITGTAVDTAYNADKQHCLLIKDKKKVQYIVLDHLISLKALSSNPHFDRIEF